MTYSGRCNCGAITATIDGKATWVRQCWCRQCQKIGCGSGTINALFRASAIALSGELSWAAYTAESGNQVERGFCAECGTQILGRNSARPDAQVVRLGFLDVPHDLAPTSAIWVDEAPSWAQIDPALEQFARQAPAPVSRKG